MLEAQMKTLQDAFAGKVAMIEEKHKNLDEYAHRSVDYYDQIQVNCNMVRDDV